MLRDKCFRHHFDAKVLLSRQGHLWQECTFSPFPEAALRWEKCPVHAERSAFEWSDRTIPWHKCRQAPFPCRWPAVPHSKPSLQNGRTGRNLHRRHIWPNCPRWRPSPRHAPHRTGRPIHAPSYEWPNRHGRSRSRSSRYETGCRPT